MKTLQQIERQKPGSINVGLNGMWTTAMNVCKGDRGVAGLWSGVGITVLGSSPSIATYFGVYSSMKKILFALPIFSSASVGAMVRMIDNYNCSPKRKHNNSTIITNFLYIIPYTLYPTPYTRKSATSG